MSELSQLEGITPEEVAKLRGTQIDTVEQFVARIKASRTAGIRGLATQTGIGASRLIELVPVAQVPVETWPDAWINDLTVRLLQESRVEGSWLERQRKGLKQFGSNSRKSWISWQTNLPILILFAGLFCLFILSLRAIGIMGSLPQPLGLSDKILIAAHDLNSGAALRSGDLAEALLPSQDDYFKGAEKLDGLILARNVGGSKPLRHGDVLRPQVIANRDIPASVPIEKEALTLVWSPYHPGAATSLEDVLAHRAKRPLRKDAIVLSEFIEETK